MLELILIRHGETNSNIRGTHLGWTDVSLNETGMEQAEQIAEILKEETIDGIYASPLQRAVQTAQSINRFHNKKVEIVDGLKERNFGIWEDLIYEEIKEKHRALHDEWIQNWINFRIPEGESASETFDRMVKAVDGITGRHESGKVLLVTHLGTIRNIIAYLLGMSIEGSWHFRVLNGSITRIQITDGYGVLTALNER